jgi:hypothetical protein
MSGFCVSSTKLGMPDTGLITYSEMQDQVSEIFVTQQQYPFYLTEIRAGVMQEIFIEQSEDTQMQEPQR